MAIAKILYKSFYWRAFQLASSVVVNICFARLLRSSVSAQLYSLVYIFSLFISFFTLGLDVGLNYFISQGLLTTTIARKIIGSITAVALLISLPLVFLGYHIIPYPEISRKMILLFAACQIAGGLLTTLSGALFTASGQNHVSAKVSFVANWLMAASALIIARLYAGAALAVHLFAVYFIFYLAVGITLFVLAGFLPKNQVDRDKGVPAIGKILRFCFFAFFIGFVFFIGGRLGLYLLPQYVSAAEAGNYIQAFRIVEYLSVITGFFYYPFITLAAGADKPKTKSNVLLLVRFSNTAVLLFSLMAVVTGWFVFPFVFGSSFSPLYGIFIGFIPGLFATCSSTFMTAYFFGVGAVRYNLFSAFIQLSAAAILFFLLTPRWGVRGAALAYSGGAVLSMIYDCRKYSNFYDFRFRELLLASKADWIAVRTFAQISWTTGKRKGATGDQQERSQPD